MGAQCTSNLERGTSSISIIMVIIVIQDHHVHQMYYKPDIEVGEQGVKKLGKFGFEVILRLGDPKLKTCHEK